jgi:hypothetical protein
MTRVSPPQTAQACPDHNEGQLSVARARLVRNYALAAACTQAGLAPHVRLRAFEPRDWGPLALAGRGGTVQVRARVRPSAGGGEFIFFSF